MSQLKALAAWPRKRSPILGWRLARPLRSSWRMNFASSQMSTAISGATEKAMAVPGPYCSEPMAFS